MPILIALLGLAVGAWFFLMRTRNAAHVATDLLDVANDVRLAARRFRFQRRTNIHPVESIEDPNIAIVAVALAFLDLDDLPTQEQRDRLLAAAQALLGLSQADAEEMQVLGRWLVAECRSADAAVSRLARKLYKLQGQDAFEPLLLVLNRTLGGSEGGLSDRQREALDEVRLAFRIR